MRTCTACGKAKPESAFAARNDCSSKKRRRCKACRSSERKWRYLTDPEHERHHSWRAQGIDVAQAKSLLAKHDGKCGLCGGHEPKGMGTWHVDHEHTTGELRGLLCFPCNVLLGKVERIGLRKIENYVRRHGGTATNA